MASVLSVQGSKDQNYIVYEGCKHLEEISLVAQNILIMPGATLSIEKVRIKCRNFINAGGVTHELSRFEISGQNIDCFEGSFEELATIMQFTPDERLKVSQKFYSGGSVGNSN